MPSSGNKNIVLHYQASLGKTIQPTKQEKKIMALSVALRSLNPALKSFAEATPRYAYGGIHIKSPEACQRIIDRLDLRDKYNSSKLDILDIYPGYGQFSTMLNYELKPRNHVIFEPRKDLTTYWENRLAHLKDTTGNAENFKMSNLNPYFWSTYANIYRNDVIPPTTVKSYDKMHDELLVVANWTGRGEESIIAQWMHCCGNRNWLAQYGKVRLVVFCLPESAQKFTAMPGNKKRKRSSLIRELYTEMNLVGIEQSDFQTGEGYDPRTLVKDQPVVISKSETLRDKDIAVIEMSTGKYTSNQISNIMHLLSQMFHNSHPIRDSLPRFGPGGEYLEKLIPAEILDKGGFHLTAEDVLEISAAYEKWPFKPPIEDTIDIEEDIDGF